MTFTLIVYVHLIATCAAIGTIVITDLRLLATMTGYRVVIPRPQRFETIMISVALVLLYLTGGALVWMGLDDNPLYLANGKLLAKLILVLLLTVNAAFLHLRVFPVLNRAQPVSQWRRLDWALVASSVSVSNSVWFFCAFLGVARAWNNTVSIGFVLLVAVLVWVVFFGLINGVLVMAARDEPKSKRDWIDSIKGRLSDFAALDRSHL